MKEARLERVLSLFAPDPRVPAEASKFLRALPAVPEGTALPRSTLPTNIWFAVPLDLGVVLVPARVAFERVRQMLEGDVPAEKKKQFLRLVGRRITFRRSFTAAEEMSEAVRAEFLLLIFDPACVYVSNKDGQKFAMSSMKHLHEPDDRLGEHKLVSPSGETNTFHLDSREWEAMKSAAKQ